MKGELKKKGLLIRKEVKLDEDVVCLLGMGAGHERRGLINYMEKILVDESIRVKNMLEELVGPEDFKKTFNSRKKVGGK